MEAQNQYGTTIMHKFQSSSIYIMYCNMCHAYDANLKISYSTFALSMLIIHNQGNEINHGRARESKTIVARFSDWLAMYNQP